MFIQCIGNTAQCGTLRVNINMVCVHVHQNARTSSKRVRIRMQTKQTLKEMNTLRDGQANTQRRICEGVSAALSAFVRAVRLFDGVKCAESTIHFVVVQEMIELTTASLARSMRTGCVWSCSVPRASHGQTRGKTCGPRRTSAARGVSRLVWSYCQGWHTQGAPRRHRSGRLERRGQRTGALEFYFNLIQSVSYTLFCVYSVKYKKLILICVYHTLYDPLKKDKNHFKKWR